MTQILLFVLGAIFVLLGIGKLLSFSPLVAALGALRIRPWARRLIGAVEVLFGLALAASALVPPLTFFAALSLLVLSVGALGVHVIRAQLATGLPAALLSIALVAAILLQPLGLRIAMLPRADDLPVALLPAETLATYETGSFLESISIAPDGGLLIAHTLGADFATFDLSGAQGTLLHRDPNGEESALVTLPEGHVAGVSAVALDGTVYLTIAGATAGIWQYRDGEDGLFIEAPEGVSWNGLTFGPDGKLYAANDRGGSIWRIDPATRNVTMVLSDERLAPRRFVALAPGANGIEFRGSELIVTVSDSGFVYGTELDGSGALGPLQVIASGVPGDDIAITSDGTIYVTTHPYNTVVAIAVDGTRSIVADASTGATGSTDLAVAPDGSTLYMVTDGGLFGGVRGAAGQLVRLDLSSTLRGS